MKPIVLKVGKDKKKVNKVKSNKKKKSSTTTNSKHTLFKKLIVLKVKEKVKEAKVINNESNKQSDNSEIHRTIRGQDEREYYKPKSKSLKYFTNRKKFKNFVSIFFRGSY
jgi:hypothetical protein